ncbi:MAG: hypothetical protein ABIE25_06395 [Thermoplasmatota archaeon]
MGRQSSRDVSNGIHNAAFKVADEVLMRSIKGLTEVITRPGLVNT